VIFFRDFRLRRTLTEWIFAEIRPTVDIPRQPAHEIKLMLTRVSWALIAQIPCFVTYGSCNNRCRQLLLHPWLHRTEEWFPLLRGLFLETNLVIFWEEMCAVQHVLYYFTGNRIDLFTSAGARHHNIRSINNTQQYLYSAGPLKVSSRLTVVKQILLAYYIIYIFLLLLAYITMLLYSCLNLFRNFIFTI